MSITTATISQTLPQAYGRVILAASGAVILSSIHSFSVSLYFRPRAQILLPQLYATSEQAAADPTAYIYNCAQRTHANYVENLFPAVAAMMLGGRRSPGTVAWLGTGWIGMWSVYFYNYTGSGNYVKSKNGEVVHGKPPMGRITALGFWVCQIALYVHAIRGAWDVYAAGS